MSILGLGCACCIFPNIVLMLLIAAVSIAYFTHRVTKSSSVPVSAAPTAAPSRSSVCTNFMRFSGYIFSLLVGLLAIYIAMLNRNDDMKQRAFATLFSMISKSPKLDAIRCDLLKNVSGHVLELGPGPGTNFRCLKDNYNIVKWTGVEPNRYFQDKIIEEKLSKNISFDVSTIWMNGENLDIAEGSIDSVISTHVLCSVTDVTSVLKQVKRSLKPGGKFYFFEHTKSFTPESTLSWLQDMFAPFVNVLGAGCMFKDTWVDIDGLSSDGFVVSYVNTSAPIGVPLFEPHVIGVAQKI